jgi:hypothetical protein
MRVPIISNAAGETIYRTLSLLLCMAGLLVQKGASMYSEWLAVEHHRIHVMELWPDGARKEAGLASARSALASLDQTAPQGCSFECATCAGRRRIVTVIPCAQRVHRDNIYLHEHNRHENDSHEDDSVPHYPGGYRNGSGSRAGSVAA